MKSVLALLATATVLATPAVAQAGKAPAPVPASIQLNESDPHLGGNASFTVSYDSRIKSPRIEVSCSQSGGVVYAETAPVGTVFTLGAYWSPWREVGGAASCTARLYYFTYKGQQQVANVLASTAFTAAG